MEDTDIKNDATNGVSAETDGSLVSGSSDDVIDERAEEMHAVPMKDRVAALPTVIRDHLFSDRWSAEQAALREKHGLTEDDYDVLFLTELHLLFGQISLDEFPDELWDRLPWDESEFDRAKALVIDCLGKVFMPLQAQVGDIVGVIARLGADPADFEAEQLEERVTTYDSAVKSVISAAGLPEMDSAKLRRLENIVESRLRDVRDEDETKRMLMKQRKTGGLEMSPSVADRIIEIAGSEMRMTRFVDAIDDAAEQDDTAGPIAEYTANEIRARLAGPPEEQKEFVSRLEALERDSGGDAAVLKEVLHDLMFGLAVENNGQWDVVAALVALARHEGLISALLEDARYTSALEAFLQERGLGSEIAGIKAQSAGVKAMNYFLQMVLRGVALLDEEGSARYGLRVTNVLKSRGEEQYAELVAFDMDEGKFVWAEPVEM